MRAKGLDWRNYVDDPEADLYELFEPVKLCKECGVVKSCREFHVQGLSQRKRKPWLCSYCKSCNKTRMKKYFVDSREVQRNAYYFRKYNITLEEYEKLLDEQGGVCKICKSSDPGSHYAFFPVDHDHTTGSVRGLLCDSCNRGLGYFKDNPHLLQEAMRYLGVSSAS